MLTRLSETHHRRWLIITGRRTGTAGEQILRTTLPAHTVARLSLFTQDGGQHYQDFLASGECVFVTEDSGTMITEAIYTQKPVIALAPRAAHPHAINKHFLEEFAARGFIQRQPIARLGRPDCPLTLPDSGAHPPTLRELGDALQTALTTP